MVRDGVWRPAAPASEAALSALRDQVRFRLPDGYLAQLARSNGGEGDLAAEPGWIVFEAAEDVVARNSAAAVEEWLPGFWMFATNGGGELIAFDLRGGEPYPIVMIPFIPMDPEEAVRIAASFDELRAFVGKCVP